MKRHDFIKNLLALGGLSFLPKQSITNYQKYYLLQCFVRGFRFYKGVSLLPSMKEGDLLELVREPENTHDPCAIALHWNKEKIGYIPAESNDLLSKLLDIGIPELVGEISFLKTEAKAWENVYVCVYVLKEIKNKIPENAAYLTVLETPHYHSLKRKDDIITIVESKDDDEIGVEDFYSYLINNSKDNDMYTFIHERLDVDAQYEQQGDFLVVNLQEIATKPSLIYELRKIESDLYNTDQMFDHNGYIVLNVRKAENFIAKISGLDDIADKLGRKFIQLHF